jgi:hypothetical protein
VVSVVVGTASADVDDFVVPLVVGLVGETLVIVLYYEDLD